MKPVELICKQLCADVSLMHQTELLHELQSAVRRDRAKTAKCIEGLQEALNRIIKGLGPKTSQQDRNMCSEQLKTIYQIFQYTHTRPKQYPELYEEFAYASHLL